MALNFELGSQTSNLNDDSFFIDYLWYFIMWLFNSKSLVSTEPHSKHTKSSFTQSIFII